MSLVSVREWVCEFVEYWGAYAPKSKLTLRDLLGCSELAALFNTKWMGYDEKYIHLTYIAVLKSSNRTAIICSFYYENRHGKVSILLRTGFVND